MGCGALGPSRVPANQRTQYRVPWPWRQRLATAARSPRADNRPVVRPNLARLGGQLVADGPPLTAQCDARCLRRGPDRRGILELATGDTPLTGQLGVRPGNGFHGSG